MLSDEQERAWYDDHRDEVLGDSGDTTMEEDATYFNFMRSGGQPSKTKAGTASNRGLQTPQVMKFFSPTAWGAFDDSPTGFYTTFRTLFNLIMTEERNLSSPYDWPSFGTSTSPYTSYPQLSTDIKQFYAAWINFATEKEFAWKDTYKVEQEMDRRTKRYVEKENMRERAAARREYNDCIRSLVLFVRRRDPRYQISLSSLSPEAFRASEAARLKALLLLAAQERAQSRAAEAAAYKAQDWQKADAKSSMGEWGERSEGEDAETSDSDVEEEWCVAVGRGS